MKGMKTVEIDGVSLTEEQIMQAYGKLQELEFEYPMWHKSNRHGYVVRFDALNVGEVVQSDGKSYRIGVRQSEWVGHTDASVWTQVDEPELHERCKEGYAVYGNSYAYRESGPEYYNNFNIYPTTKLAAKAAKLMKESNKLITACLLVDPDYEPDWSDNTKEKHSAYAYFNADLTTYKLARDYECKCYAAYVSSEKKAEEVCKLMNAWGGV